MQRLCTIEDLRPDGGLAVEGRIAGETVPLMLFLAGGDVQAYRNICPHMGRRLDWAPGDFLLAPDGNLVCPHHGACFDLAGGECVEGPCRGAFLSRVKVVLKDGSVLLAD